MDDTRVRRLWGRRGLLGRGAVLAGGLAAALGSWRSVRAAEHEVSPSGASGSGPGTATLQLYGRGWHLQTANRKRGTLPTAGDQLAMFGELLDAPEGEKLGEFYAAGFFFDAPFGPSELSVANLEQHTFKLRDGTLVGMGTASQDEGVYAIVGGTGRYAGARGSYVARLQPIELGGDGSAEFTLTLLA